MRLVDVLPPALAAILATTAATPAAQAEARVFYRFVQGEPSRITIPDVPAPDPKPDPTPTPDPVPPTPTPDPTPTPPTPEPPPVVVPPVVVPEPEPEPEPQPPAPPPVTVARVEVIYEKRCSFDVVKLSPGTYYSDPGLAATIYGLWGSTNGQSNKWFYAHQSENCTAAGGSVGYRFSWSTTFATRFPATVDKTGRASAVVQDDRLVLTVSQPIWLSGEIAQGVPLRKAQ